LFLNFRLLNKKFSPRFSDNFSIVKKVRGEGRRKETATTSLGGL